MDKDETIIDNIKLLLCVIGIKILNELSDEAERSFDALCDKLTQKSRKSKDIF